ncbi:MAG TPA: 30S ribosomal protein S2 [Planctomycetota bacterium]
MPPLSISARELLASGVHYGHKVSRWNPKMRPYIHAKHSLIHIIDVRETIKGLVRAWHVLKNLAARGELVLFIGTKRQAGGVIKEQARRCGMPYVSERWLGGTLTNYETIRTRLNRLKEIETWELDSTILRYSKKEQSAIHREKRKLLRNLDGLRQMDRLPSTLVIVDPMMEKIAVAEAHTIGAATVALIDSDGDPDAIDVAIPGNDDSIKVVNIIVTKLADAILEGKANPVGMPRPEEIQKAGAVSISVPEKAGAVNIGKGGRPRRVSTPGGGGMGMGAPRPAAPAPAPRPALPTQPAAAPPAAAPPAGA